MIKFNNNKSKNILKKIRDNYEVIAIRKELLKYLAGMVAQEIEDIEEYDKYISTLEKQASGSYTDSEDYKNLQELFWILDELINKK